MLLVSPPVVLLMLFLPNGHVVSTCSALIGPFNWGEGLFMKAFVCLLRLGEINFCFFLAPKRLCLKCALIILSIKVNNRNSPHWFHFFFILIYFITY